MTETTETKRRLPPRPGRRRLEDREALTEMNERWAQLRALDFSPTEAGSQLGLNAKLTSEFENLEINWSLMRQRIDELRGSHSETLSQLDAKHLRQLLANLLTGVTNKLQSNSLTISEMERALLLHDKLIQRLNVRPQTEQKQEEEEEDIDLQTFIEDMKRKLGSEKK